MWLAAAGGTEGTCVAAEREDFVRLRAEAASSLPPSPASRPSPAAPARRWWAVVVLAALPSLGAGGDPEAPPESWTQLWLFRFLVNVAGYATILVPGYLLVQYFRRINYLETGVRDGSGRSGTWTEPGGAVQGLLS